VEDVEGECARVHLGGDTREDATGRRRIIPAAHIEEGIFRLEGVTVVGKPITRLPTFADGGAFRPAEAATAFARGGFRLPTGMRCGDHEAATYLARVIAMKRTFLRLAAEG